MRKNIFSFDAETNGLWGEAFAIGAIVYDSTGKEVDKFVAKLPDSVITDTWVKENVKLDNVPVTHTTYEEMLKDFSRFYLKHKENSTFIVHMGYIVESKLIRDMVEHRFIGAWDAPYPLIDISGNLEQAGENPVSVDAYVKKYNIEIEDYGTTHNPLYDSEVTAKAYIHLCKKIK